MINSKVRISILITGIIFFLMISCGAASAATIKVNPGIDAIKNAVSSANPGDTLYLKSGTYYEHDILINKDLSISGPVITSGEPTAVIDANSNGRAFQINSGKKVYFKYIYIKNGFTNDDYGGAINNVGGDLTIKGCKFYKNYADMYGGAIYNVNGNLKITDSNLFLNSALHDGGCICNVNGQLNIYKSNIEGCSANRGGGIFNDGTMKLTETNFFENKATSFGGAISNWDVMNLSYCDFQMNTATEGQDIFNNGGTASNRVLKYNRLLDGNVILSIKGKVNAEYNYWGSNDSPSGQVKGIVDYTPWIKDISGYPTVSSSSPSKGATKVARNKTITVNFNEYIKPENLDIELLSSTGKAVKITLSVSGKTLTIKHSALLSANTKYYLKLHRGCVTDMRGYPLAAKTFSFTTGNS